MTNTEGGLPAGWVWTTFSSVAQHRLGKMLDKRKNEGTLRPYLRNSNVRWHGFDLDNVKEMRVEDSEMEKYTVRRGDLVICEGGEPGRSAIWTKEEPMVYQKAVHRARPYDGITAEYLLYFLEYAASSGQLAKHFTGSTINHLTGRALAEVEVPLAPSAEQSRIVDALESAIADLEAGIVAIELAQRDLERYRRSVLKAAVSGDLAADWRRQHPDAEPASDLLNRILEKRQEQWEADQLAGYEAKGKTPPKGWRQRYKSPAEQEEKALPDIPEGWTWASLEQLTRGDRLVQYGILKPGKDHPGGVPYVKVMNMREDRIDVDGLRRTTPEIATKYARASLAKGDLLLSIRGTYGRVAEVPDVLEGGNITQDSVRIAPAPEVDRDFLALCLRSPASQAFFHSVAKGAAVQGVNVRDVRKTPIPLPPLQEQIAIVEAVDERLSVADSVAAELDRQRARADRLRQATLKDAFSGDLVPQDPSDEPASALLERAKAELVERKKTKKSRKRKRTMSKPEPTPPASLVEIVEAEGPIEPRELWKRSGIESIDAFYAALKVEVADERLGEEKPSDTQRLIVLA